MTRLESAMTSRLQPGTANKSEFTGNAEAIFHEAEIVAAISEVLTKGGMEDADDDEYKSLAAAMKKAARDVSDAVKLKNDEQARQAVGQISQACTQCHELYRG
jgi:cytochrome c556